MQFFITRGKNFVFHSGEEHRNVKRTQFVLIEGGYRYVEVATDMSRWLPICRGGYRYVKVATDMSSENLKTFRGGFSQLHLNAKSVVLYNDADAGMWCSAHFSVFTCPT